MTKQSMALTALVLVVGVVAVTLYVSERPTTVETAPKPNSSSTKPKGEPAKPVTPPAPPPQKSATLTYESATDLKAYLAQLEASGAKPADIAVTRARAIEECLPFIRMPNFAFDTVKARQGIAGADTGVQQNYAKIY